MSRFPLTLCLTSTSPVVHHMWSNLTQTVSKEALLKHFYTTFLFFLMLILLSILKPVKIKMAFIIL